MAKDIDVDREELSRFLDALSHFQELARERFKAVEQDWQKCNESWKGDSKDRFSRDFEQTRQTVSAVLNTSDDAVQWLRNYDTILEEFERDY